MVWYGMVALWYGEELEGFIQVAPPAVTVAAPRKSSPCIRITIVRHFAATPPIPVIGETNWLGGCPDLIVLQIAQVSCDISEPF